MNRWFRVVGPGPIYFEDTARTLHVPGMSCTVCGTTWADGCPYPTVTRRRLPPEITDDPWPQDAQVVKRLLSTIASRLGDGRPLSPGVSFGPPTARLCRQPPRVFEGSWALFLAPDVSRRPEVRALGLTLARATLRTIRGKRLVYDEVEAWPVARRARLRFMRRKLQRCDACGYRAYEPRARQALLASSLRGLHVARESVAKLTTFVSDPFRQVLERYGQGADLSFEPVRVV